MMALAEQALAFGGSNRVVVTGAGGFIGQAVCTKLVSMGMQVIGAVREHNDLGGVAGVREIALGNFDERTDWGSVLEGASCVVHLAARVHVMRDSATDQLADYRAANVGPTLNLARQAAQSGVKRFVFLSSIKVNGESSSVGRPFTPNDEPRPIDPYGVSKHEAEQALAQLTVESGLEVVTIRPVLVYGPGVKANFRTMMRWMTRGVPLPLGALHNRRSLVALDNLVDFVAVCTLHPAAANQVFLVSDGKDLSVTELLTQLAAALNRPARLLPVPESLLRLVGRLLHKEDVVGRLCGTLQVDIAKAKELLGWTPPVSIEAALRKTALHFR